MYSQNNEPRLDDMLEDPIVHLVLARDNLCVHEVRSQMHDARKRISEARSQDKVISFVQQMTASLSKLAPAHVPGAAAELRRQQRRSG
jgi:hypothetical protein